MATTNISCLKSCPALLHFRQFCDSRVYIFNANLNHTINWIHSVDKPDELVFYAVLSSNEVDLLRYST